MSMQSANKTSLMDNLRSRLEGVNLRQNGIFLALIGLLIFFAATTPGAASLTPDNVSNLVMQNGYILVLAIGMVMVIIAGHIDLSVGSSIAFTSVVGALLIQRGWGTAQVVFAMILSGGLIGLLLMRPEADRARLAALAGDVELFG